MANVIRGTFLRPGVSKNRRLYTVGNIGRAVQHMQERLSNPDAMPITMHGSHAAGWSNDTLGTLAKVTKVWQRPDGSGAFEAVPSPTQAGQDMAKLASPKNGFVKGLSVRGMWMSDPVKVQAHDGDEAVTADDLDVMGIDFTHSPGVLGAGVENDNMDENSANFDPDIIFEDVEEASFVDESIDEAGNAPGNGKLPYGTSDQAKYADPGYQKDKKKRYPLNTASRVRAAWGYIHHPSNAAHYSSAQLSRIKSKIKSAAKKFKIDLSGESEFVANEIRDVLEAYASMSIENGSGSVSASGYTDDGGKLMAVAQRIAMSAMAGMHTMDPDEDGDIDLVMPDGTTDSSRSNLSDEDDNNMSPDVACIHTVPEGALFCPTCGSPVPQVESFESMPTETDTAPAPQNNAVDEPTAPVVATAAPNVTLTQEQFDALLARVAAPTPAPAPVAAPVATDAPVGEAAPAEPAAPISEGTQTFTLEQVQEMAAKAAADAVEAVRAQGVADYRGAGGGRKGLVEDGEPTHTHALHEMSRDELDRTTYETFYQNPVFNRIFKTLDEAHGINTAPTA